MNLSDHARTLIALLVATVLCISCSQESQGFFGDESETTVVNRLPDFASYQDVKAKKLAFFNFLRPIVETENRKVQAKREQMLVLRAQLDRGRPLSATQSDWLLQLAADYKVAMPSIDDEQGWLLLKRRVDTVPFRLALAQAANESSWGTSRFARQGLNLFGQWCFSKGCGLVPARRKPGLAHEVATYDSVNDSVAAYIRSINRVPIYTPLRKLRSSMRNRGEQPTAIALARELAGYSERREEYVKEIQSMIRSNFELMAGSSQLSAALDAASDKAQ